MKTVHTSFVYATVWLVLISGASLRAQPSTSTTLHAKVRPLPHKHQGPFVRRDDGAIVALHATDVLVSTDDGKTWEIKPLFSSEQQAARPLSVRDENALVLTRSGVIIASFMNDREKKWTWSNELKDAPALSEAKNVSGKTVYDGPEVSEELVKLISLYNDPRWYGGGETPEMRTIRFRTLGCWPLTAAVESDATDLDAVIEEVLSAKYSERAGRLIDHDQAGAMEMKKREGYF